MTEERDAEMLGEIVWRIPCETSCDEFAHDVDMDPEDRDVFLPGRWHAEPVSVALVEVVEAAQNRERALQAADRDAVAMWNSRLKYALDNLDAALGGGRNG